MFVRDAPVMGVILGDEAEQASRSKHPAAGVSQQTLVLWERLQKSTFVRIALLGPTALTAIAGLQGIGEIAHWITQQWSGVASWLYARVEFSLPDDFPLSAWAIVTVLFFLPFVIAGIPVAISRKPLSIGMAIAAIASVLLLLTLQTASSEGPDMLTTETALVVGAAIACCAALYCLPIVVLMLSKRRAKFRRWERLWLPVSFIATLFLGNTLTGQPVPDWGTVAFVVFYSLPLLAPRRLTEVASIVIAIVVISLAYDGISLWLGLQPPPVAQAFS